MDESSSLYNEDLAPVPKEKRTWGVWNFAALWIGMVVCIPAYMLAASLMQKGMYWWQALLTIGLANSIVLIPMLLNAHAGTKYGIPFPVLLRSSFGVIGANIPALMRAMVACGWFGIQTWIGGSAIYSVVIILCTQTGTTPIWNENTLPVLGINGLQFASFMVFWAINIAVIIRGIDCIKWLESWAAPLLLLIGAGLFVWAISAGGGIANILSAKTIDTVRGQDPNYNFWVLFFPLLTGMVGFWSTVALNIPDFTRYARSQRDQLIGQAISLPTTMTLFSFIGISVTAATVVVFGEAIWDPVVLLSKFESPLVVSVALIALVVATLSTNIAANVVSPANDFSNLSPKRISFRGGGLITGVIGIVIMPWRLLADLGAYIFTWLIGYGALLGTIGGIMIADYYLVRKTELDINELYNRDGIYSFGASGINWRAIVALIVGVAPNVPGFLHSASQGSIEVMPFLNNLYTYAWFVGLILAGSAHYLLSTLFPVRSLIQPELGSTSSTLQTSTEPQSLQGGTA